MISTFGNTLQIIMERNKWMNKREDMTNNAKINSLLIISLAFADFLVGVENIFLAQQSTSQLNTLLF